MPVHRSSSKRYNPIKFLSPLVIDRRSYRRRCRCRRRRIPTEYRVDHENTQIQFGADKNTKGFLHFLLRNLERRKTKGETRH